MHKRWHKKSFSQWLQPLILWPVLLACGAFADEGNDTTLQPKVYVTAWGLTLESDGSGFYNELGHFILKDTTADYDIEPYRRAVRRFLKDGESCLYPKNIEALLHTRDINTTDGLIESLPVIRSIVALFTPEGAPLVRGPSDLAGKRVAYALGAKVPEYLGADGAFFIAVSNEVDKARMLLNNRVDVMIANLPDARLVYRHLDSALPPYDPMYHPFQSAKIRVVCHDTPTNRTFMEQVNKNLLSLHENGGLAAFLEKHDLNAPLFLDDILAGEPAVSTTASAPTSQQ